MKAPSPLFFFLILFSQLSLATETKAKDVLCSKFSDSATCRRKEFYYRCGETANHMCLPTEDEPNLEDDNTVLCSCIKRPPEESEWRQLSEKVARVVKFSKDRKVTIPIGKEPEKKKPVTTDIPSIKK